MFPEDILQKIFSYVPCSINVCLVNKSIKRKRTPVTLLCVDTILHAEHWLMKVMGMGKEHNESTQALEISIWLCLKHNLPDKAKQYIDIATAMLPRNEPLLQRVAHYQSIFDPTIITVEDIPFDYIECLKSGNIAHLLCAKHENIVIPNHFTMIQMALSNKRLLFGTYMMLHSGCLINYDMFEIFVSTVKGCELIQWLVSRFLKRNDYNCKFLMTNLAGCGNFEAFRYFHEIQDYPIHAKCLKIAEIQNNAEIATYIRSK